MRSENGKTVFNREQWYSIDTDVMYSNACIFICVKPVMEVSPSFELIIRYLLRLFYFIIFLYRDPMKLHFLQEKACQCNVCVRYVKGKTGFDIEINTSGKVRHVI